MQLELVEFLTYGMGGTLVEKITWALQNLHPGFKTRIRLYVGLCSWYSHQKYTKIRSYPIKTHPKAYTDHLLYLILIEKELDPDATQKPSSRPPKDEPES